MHNRSVSSIWNIQRAWYCIFPVFCRIEAGFTVDQSIPFRRQPGSLVRFYDAVYLSIYACFCFCYRLHVNQFRWSWIEREYVHEFARVNGWKHNICTSFIWAKSMITWSSESIRLNGPTSDGYLENRWRDRWSETKDDIMYMWTINIQENKYNWRTYFTL